MKQQIFILRYDNNTQDEGFEKISDYILENYESVENFCIDSVQSYYCGIIEEYIHSL